MSEVDAATLAQEIIFDVQRNDPSSVVRFFDISFLVTNRDHCGHLRSSEFVSRIGVKPWSDAIDLLQQVPLAPELAKLFSRAV
jgi:hypothetical protein